MTTAEAFQIGQMEDVPRDISSPLLFDGVTTDYVFFYVFIFYIRQIEEVNAIQPWSFWLRFGGFTYKLIHKHVYTM